MKRLFDLLCSVPLLVILSPLLLLVAIIMKFEGKGPIIFKQKRGGYKQKHFYIYKFRTMIQNAENTGLGYKTEKNDPRITRVGNVLRKYSIDELPQLINIIKGDMSIVGPRPALTVQTDNYNNYQLQRLQVKPGITGLAQINGRNTLTWDERIKWDVEYVNKASLGLDIKIILKTVFIVLRRKDIYKDKAG